MAGPNGQTVGDLPTNRIATHLHGGLTPWFSDGTPFQWFTPTGRHGASFMNVPGFPSLPGTGTYYYPNDQARAWCGTTITRSALHGSTRTPELRPPTSSSTILKPGW